MRGKRKRSASIPVRSSVRWEAVYPLKREEYGNTPVGEKGRESVPQELRKRNALYRSGYHSTEGLLTRGRPEPRGTRGEGRPTVRGTETHYAPACCTRTEAERLRSAVQERALPEPAAEWGVDNSVENVEICKLYYGNCKRE